VLVLVFVLVVQERKGKERKGRERV